MNDGNLQQREIDLAVGLVNTWDVLDDEPEFLGDVKNLRKFLEQHGLDREARVAAEVFFKRVRSLRRRVRSVFEAETESEAVEILNDLLADSVAQLRPGKDGWRFCWITDFPLFDANEEGRLVAAHHPFTSPHPDDLARLESDPGSVRARAYDLVLNGNEIAGGSIRIHRSDLQARVFRALGLSDEDANAKFGFLLEAFKYGPPPHGGIAAGVDRLAMLLCGADSLRDVIAFPKTQKGTDMMTDAPGPVAKRQLDELHIAIKE
jgi:aspartyl-tRNA synthetase